jgi:uncharacterized secreted protein with C-terminal beta-propeller domain
MKLKKQIRKLQDLLNAETREKLKHRDDLRTLLKKMKKKEVSLSERVEIEINHEKRDRLVKEIDMLHAQRKKGVLALKELDRHA